MGSGTQAFERWNTHFSTYVEQEVLGLNLRLAQDPSSEHLGTTVWDASIVLAKYFEKNIRKGEFSRPKATGKRAIELGAGMGLAGLALAMIGADVLLTDVKEVLPLLQRNYENNISTAALRAAGNESHISSCGRVTVAELDWSQPEQYTGLAPPPFDYVLAADCIYHETLLRHLYRVLLAITSERSTIIIANERRSESVQNEFISLFSDSFTFKKVPLTKQDPDYSHPAIELYILKKKKGASDASLKELEAKEASDMAEVANSLQQLATSPGKAEQEQQQQSRGQQVDRQHQVSSMEDSRRSSDSNSSCIADTAFQEQRNPRQQLQQQEAQQSQDLCMAAPCSSTGQAAPQEQQFQTRRAGVEAARLLAAVPVPGE